MAQLQFHELVDRNVFHRGAPDEGVEQVIARETERLDHAIGQRLAPELVPHGVGELVVAHHAGAEAFLLELVVAGQRHALGFERRQALGPAVGNRVAALDGVEKIFRETFLGHFLGLGFDAFKGKSRIDRSAAHASGPAVRRSQRLGQQPTRRHVLVLLARFLTGQLHNVFHQPHRADDQPHLGVLVILTALVVDPHRPAEGHQFFILRRLGHVVRAPGNAAGEITNLHHHIAGKFTVDAPLQRVRHARWKARVEHLHRISVGQRLEFNGRGIDERVGPGELQLVHPLAKREVPGLLDQREIHGVVNGKLHRVAGGERDDVDAGMGGEHVRQDDRQNQQLVSE